MNWRRIPGMAMLAGAVLVAGCDSSRRAALRELGERGIDANGLSLLDAVEGGRRDEIDLLIAAGVYTGQRNAGGETPLHVAIREGRPGVAWELIEAGAELDAETPGKVTPLGLAMVSGQSELAGRLLDFGATTDGLTPDGERLLPWAIRHGRSAFVRRLIDGGADPHQHDVAGNPLLHVAMEAGRRELVSELIELGADCAAKNAAGESALVVALRLGWRDQVTRLVLSGADPNLADREGVPPLERALVGGDEALARELLELGARPRAGNLDEALAQAYRRRDRSRCRLLLRLGARPSPPGGVSLVRLAADEDRTGYLHLFLGYTATVPDGLLYENCRSGRAHIVSLLLAHGADPNPSRAPFLDTPFSRSLRFSGDALACRLLDAGAHPGSRAFGGQRPLHVALALGRARTVRRLLERGEPANAEIPTPVTSGFLKLVRGANMRWLLRKDSRITPLMLAVDSGSIDSARALLDYGAKTDVWTRRSSMWPINIAAGHKDVPMMRLLLGKDPHVENRQVTISLSEQRLRVYDESGAEVFETRVSTGKSGYATPMGEYAITNRHRQWTSTLYHSSMPYFQRLSCRDFGMHQGYVPGYPASHGCIRVPAGDASKLFQLLELGDRVRIVP